MEFSALQIAGFLKGEIEGDPEVKVNTLSKIEEAGPGEPYISGQSCLYIIYL
jgi:UDP-3-O-[3-hydroxymyristoyl] glucosamine N-acyltransferase